MSFRSTLERTLPPPAISTLRWIAKRFANPVRTFLLRHSHVGAGSYLAPDVHVLGWRHTFIGRDTVLCEGVCVNINHRETEGTGVFIGDHCFIGRRNFLNSGTEIVLKDFCLTGPDCRFNGADHVFSDPFRPYIATGTTEDSSIVLGVNCWLGANVTILGDVAIGHGCVIGSGSLVTKSAPPFSLLVGSPARIVKRYDALSHQWIAAADFTEAMGAALPDEVAYLEILKRNAPEIRIPTAAAGKAQGDLP